MAVGMMKLAVVMVHAAVVRSAATVWAVASGGFTIWLRVSGTGACNLCARNRHTSGQAHGQMSRQQGIREATGSFRVCAPFPKRMSTRSLDRRPPRAARCAAARCAAPPARPPPARPPPARPPLTRPPLTRPPLAAPPPARPPPTQPPPTDGRTDAARLVGCGPVKVGEGGCGWWEKWCYSYSTVWMSAISSNATLPQP